jgi:hypothetical protein
MSRVLWLSLADIKAMQARATLIGTPKKFCHRVVSGVQRPRGRHLHVDNSHRQQLPGDHVLTCLSRINGWTVCHSHFVPSVRSSLCTFLISCPPNWFRSAALNRAAKLYGSRLAKRANKLAASAGTGTSSSSAAWSVQRPSPLSATNGAIDFRAPLGIATA